MLLKFPQATKDHLDPTFLKSGAVPFAKHNVLQKTSGLQTGYLTEHTLFFIIKGKKTFHLPDTQLTLSEMDLLFVKRGVYTISEQLSTGGSFEALMLFIPEKMVSVLPAATRDFESEGSSDFVVIRKNKLITAFEQGYLNLFVSHVDLLDKLLPLKLNELFILLASTPESKAIASLLHSFGNGKASDIGFIVKEHLLKPLSVSDYARLCCRSVTSFKRDFSKLFHSSPKKWINEQRLIFAHNLLKSSHNSIADIAEECGFDTTSNFIRLYKKQFGTTPGKHRV